MLGRSERGRDAVDGYLWGVAVLELEHVGRVHPLVAARVAVAAEEHVVPQLGRRVVVAGAVGGVGHVGAGVVGRPLSAGALGEVEVVPVVCVVGVVEHGAGTPGVAGVHELAGVGVVFDLVAGVEGVTEGDRGLFVVVDGCLTVNHFVV